MTEAAKPTLIFIKRAISISLAILAASILGAMALGASNSVASIAAGFAIAATSFLVIAFVVTKSFLGSKKATLIAMLGMVKMCLIGAVLWWLMSHKIVEPIGFFAGFTTVVAALVIEGIRMR